MLEPLYLPDDFFASIILKFFMSMVVEVLGVGDRGKEINFIFYIFLN